jgi:hypothetical protein
MGLRGSRLTNVERNPEGIKQLGDSAAIKIRALIALQLAM